MGLTIVKWFGGGKSSPCLDSLLKRNRRKRKFFSLNRCFKKISAEVWKQSLTLRQYAEGQKSGSAL